MPMHVHRKNTNIDYTDISTGAIIIAIYTSTGIGTGKRARGHGPL